MYHSWHGTTPTRPRQKENTLDQNWQLNVDWYRVEGTTGESQDCIEGLKGDFTFDYAIEVN